jgi:glutathione S-transferase
MAELVLYHSVASRAFVTLWMLEELGIPFRIEDTDIRSGKSQTPSYLAINPMGKVPTLRDGETVVTESCAICLYLADRFGYGTFCPKVDDPRRGAYLRWSVFATSVLDPSINLPPSNDRQEAYHRGWGAFESVVVSLEHALTPGPYLLGGWFTAADVIFGGVFAFAMFNKKLPERPVFIEYHGRLNGREAFKRAAERTWPPSLFKVQ